jgi:tripartite ATP-independent transporter DctM subunit
VEQYAVGLIGVVVLCLLLFVGVPVAFGAAAAGFVGIIVLAGINPALNIMGTVPFAQLTTYSFTVIPLFVMLGYFAFAGGVAEQAFEVGKKWLGHIRGGMAFATIFGCACFGACCGVSVASAAIFGKLAIPEMEKQGISKTMAAGLVASSGTLACMIPPSGVAVLYAIMAGTSVGKQLIAGLLPGILTAVIYAVTIWLWIKIDPKAAGFATKQAPWKEKVSSLPQLWGIFVIALIIIGGIYCGIFTPTEAAAIGALVALLVMVINTKGSSLLSKFKEAMLETARTTGMVSAILFGIIIFANFIALSRVSAVMIDWIAALTVNRYFIMIGIFIFYIILGLVFEAVGLLLLSVPFLLPVVVKLGFDPIWFGVVAIAEIEMAQISPPIGLTCFVVHAVAPHISLSQVFRGIYPFMGAECVALGLLLAFPEIATFLPNLM